MRFAGFKSTSNGERNFPQCSRQENIIYKTSAVSQRKPKASVILEGGVGGWVQFGEALGTAYLVEFQRQCTTAAMKVFLFCHEGVILLFGTISTAPWPESLSSAFFRRTTGTHGNCSPLFSSSTGLDPQLFQADSESPIRPISRNDGLGLFWDLGLHKGVASCNSCAGRVDSIRDTRSRIFPARSEKKKAQLVVRDFFSNLLLFDNEDSSQVCFKKTQKDWSAFATGDRWSLELEAYDSYDDKSSIVISKAHGCSIKYYQHHPNPMLSSAGWRVPQAKCEIVLSIEYR